jgi:hypothetical protein
MAAFTEINWQRFDHHAIVESQGLATIEERRRAACRVWLEAHGYQLYSVDCSGGYSTAVPEFGRLFRWEEKFGYALTADRYGCGLNALNDGFEFDVPTDGGVVLELVRPDRKWKSKNHREWLCGVFSIASQHSRFQLALGRRFFTVLIVPGKCRMLGAEIETFTVPWPYWDPCRAIHEFEPEE